MTTQTRQLPATTASASVVFPALFAWSLLSLILSAFVSPEAMIALQVAAGAAGAVLFVWDVASEDERSAMRARLGAIAAAPRAVTETARVRAVKVRPSQFQLAQASAARRFRAAYA